MIQLYHSSIYTRVNLSQHTTETRAHSCVTLHHCIAHNSQTITSLSAHHRRMIEVHYQFQLEERIMNLYYLQKIDNIGNCHIKKIIQAQKDKYHIFSNRRSLKSTCIQRYIDVQMIIKCKVCGERQVCTTAFTLSIINSLATNHKLQDDLKV